MVVATRIYSANSTAVDVEQHEPPDGGPSSVRIRCKVTVQYASRKLGGKGLAVTDRQDAAWTSEVRFPVDDPSLFSRYDELCGAARDMLKAVPRLGELDLSPDNWDCRFAPEVAASQIRGRVHRDENQGRGPGWHYHFAVKLELVVTHVYSEPRAVVRWCGENVMQTVVVGSGEVCGVCMEELLRRGAPSEPVNLPCSHAFHEWCILPWLHQGSTCPACRHDLRGLVVAPWKPRSWMQKHAAR